MKVLRSGVVLTPQIVATTAPRICAVTIIVKELDQTLPGIVVSLDEVLDGNSIDF